MSWIEVGSTSRKEMNINYTNLYIMKKNSKEGWHNTLVSKYYFFFMRFVLRTDKMNWK